MFFITYKSLHHGINAALKPAKNTQYCHTKNVKFKTEGGPKSKNARKQTHFKIQFYIGIHVTKVEKKYFSKITVPYVH